MSEPTAPPPYSEKAGDPNKPYPSNNYGGGSSSVLPYPQQPQGVYWPQAAGHTQQQNAGAPHVYMPGNTTTVIVQHVNALGPRGVNMTCPHCQAQIITSTAPTPGLLTWLVAGGCVFFGFWLGCCLIPFCMDDLQDVDHKCPNCHTMLGTYKRIG